jgi:predicted nucleotidyltransferase
MVTETQTLERKLASVVRDRSEVLAAYAFGSAVRGRRRQDSDVDVAVIFEAGLDQGDRFRVRCELASAVAEAVGTEFADIVDLEAAPPLLAHQILGTGRVLFCRDERRRVLVTARQIMRFIDTAPLRRVLDEATFRRLREGSFGHIA